jgi:uracil-DNA glycosylase
MEQVDALHARILACRRCEEAGFIPQAAPVVAGRWGNRVMLIGQAPGQVEQEVRRPFQGKAGRELFRWMGSVGIEEEAFRDQVYMTAITKCFPGRAKSGTGDRRPSAAEAALCRPWLEAQLQIIRPEVILLVGGLAIDRYLPKVPLSEIIGRRFERDGVALIPLPHPSGASRWLNVPQHRALLGQALELVRREWDRVVAPEKLSAAAS